MLCNTPILMYHSVYRDQPHRGGTQRDALHAHMRWLKERGWRGVSMRDHLAAPSDHDVCLTFDDGYVNNLTYALPVLTDCGFKATFFVCTRLSGQALEWHRGDPQAIMGPEGWRALHAAGHEVGSHGMTHRRLDELSAEEARAELHNSRVDLESVVGSVGGYAFPQGRFNARALAIVRGEYSYACVTRPRGRLRQDRWTHKRINVGPRDNLRRFALKMSIPFRIACDLGL